MIRDTVKTFHIGMSGIPLDDALCSVKETYSERIVAAIFSPTIIVGRLVLAHGTIGMIEASQTRNPPTPYTRADGEL